MESENLIIKLIPITSFLKGIVIAVPIIVGALFCAGTYYRNSYFNYWGFDLEMFPMSFQTTVVYGLHAFSALGLKHGGEFVKIGAYVLYFVVFCLVLDTVVSRVVSIARSKAVHPPEWFEKTCRFFRIWIRPTDKAIPALLYTSLFILVIPLLTIVLGAFRLGFGLIGEDWAREQHAALKIEGDDASLPNLVEVKFASDVELDHSLRRQLIFCFPDDCAFLLSSGVEVVSRSNILSITGSNIRELSE